MPKYIYKAHNPKTSQVMSVTVEAATEEEANRLILNRGVIPISMQLEGAGGSLPFKKKIGRRQKTLFTTQLAVLLNAGLPLLQSLRNISKQTPNPEIKKLTTEFINALESGVSFSEALAKHPEIFNQIYVNLVKAGEFSGTLDIALERLAVQQEKDGELVSKLRAAAIYPSLVIVVMLGVTVFMLVVLLPQIESLLASEDQQLFFLTNWLLVISRSMTNYWYVYAIIVFLSVSFLLTFPKTPVGRRFTDNLKLSAPGVKQLFRSIYMARFSRTMAVLFAAGINLVESLNITNQGVNNSLVSASIDDAVRVVESGGSLSDALQKDPNFDILVSDMIKIGEESGKTEEMLRKCAEQFERDVDNKIKTLTALLEPVMIIVLGIGALILMLAVLVPILNSVNSLQF